MSFAIPHGEKLPPRGRWTRRHDLIHKVFIHGLNATTVAAPLMVKNPWAFDQNGGFGQGKLRFYKQKLKFKNWPLGFCQQIEVLPFNNEI